jgi:hypothetical protein
MVLYQIITATAVISFTRNRDKSQTAFAPAVLHYDNEICQAQAIGERGRRTRR